MTDRSRAAPPPVPAVPRIPPLPADGASDAAREVFAFWGEPGSWEKGSATNTMNTFAQHPPLGIAHSRFGRHFLIDADLSVRARELVVLRVSWHTRSEYEWHYHVAYALNGGLTIEEIAAIREDVSARDWDEHDRALLAMVDELFETSRVSDGTWAALTRHFDTRQLMDLVFTAGNYTMTAWAIAALGIQIEDHADPIGFDLKTRSGRAPAAKLKPGEAADWTVRNAATTDG